MGGARERVNRVRKSPFYASLVPRLSLSFDFSRIKFARAKKVRKGEGEPGDEASFMPHFGGSPFETGGLPELLTLDL